MLTHYERQTLTVFLCASYGQQLDTEMLLAAVDAGAGHVSFEKQLSRLKSLPPAKKRGC